MSEKTPKTAALLSLARAVKRQVMKEWPVGTHVTGTVQRHGFNERTGACEVWVRHIYFGGQMTTGVCPSKLERV